MLTITSIIARSILVVGLVGGLAALADGAVRSELERAVPGDLASLDRTPAPVRIVHADKRYVAERLDRSRLDVTLRMVGTDDAH